MTSCYFSSQANVLNVLCSRKALARTVSLERCNSCPAFVSVEPHKADAREFMG